jgi:hypothetical protein
MCVRKTPLAEVFYSSPATAPEKNWCLVDEGDYSSLFPGNSARKEADGAELTGENIVDVGVSPVTAPEKKLLAFDGV